MHKCSNQEALGLNDRKDAVLCALVCDVEWLQIDDLSLQLYQAIICLFGGRKLLGLQHITVDLVLAGDHEIIDIEVAAAGENLQA